MGSLLIAPMLISEFFNNFERFTVSCKASDQLFYEDEVVFIKIELHLRVLRTISNSFKRLLECVFLRSSLKMPTYPYIFWDQAHVV